MRPTSTPVRSAGITPSQKLPVAFMIRRRGRATTACREPMLMSTSPLIMSRDSPMAEIMVREIWPSTLERFFTRKKYG